jgi:hypothetical protein
MKSNKYGPKPARAGKKSLDASIQYDDQRICKGAANNNRGVTPLPEGGRLPSRLRRERKDDIATSRRLGDQHLAGFLDPEELATAEKIALGFQFRTEGLGARTQSYCPQPKSTRRQENWEFDLMQAFTDWAEQVQREGLSLAATLDILAFGKSCRKVDKHRRKRNGFAKANLQASLRLYR